MDSDQLLSKSSENFVSSSQAFKAILNRLQSLKGNM